MRPDRNVVNGMERKRGGVRLHMMATSMTTTCSGASRVQRFEESHRRMLGFCETDTEETRQRSRVTDKQITLLVEQVLFL